MISSLEPVEFNPRGRKVVQEHPGKNIRKGVKISNEYVLLERMQHVNINSKEGNFKENWTIREIYEQSGETSQSEDLNFLTHYTVNSEEELYFKGNTAVWSTGISNSINEKTSSEICYTSETPIQFAFFCTKNFLDADYKINDKDKSVMLIDKTHGIAIIDTVSLKVYSVNGENLVTSIETPISKIWLTKYCVLIEKEASSSVIEGQVVSMPRIFSLIHPLDDMFPVLLKAYATTNYVTEAEYKIIFTSEISDIILLFDARHRKHFVCKLRKATQEETGTVTNLYDHTNVAATSSIGGFSSVTQLNVPSQNSLKMSSFVRQNVSGLQREKNLTGLNGTNFNLSNNPINTPSTSYRTNLASSLIDGTSTMQNKSSISMNARKIGDFQSKPLVPDLIMEQIWIESSDTYNEYHEMATSGFLHTDIIGQNFLCFLLAKSYKLNLININKTTQSNTPIFGATSSISAKDAVALPKMNMIAVLAPCGTLMLYTGSSAIGKVHVGGILSSFTTTNTFSNSSFGSSFPKRSSLLPNVAVSAKCESKFDEEIHMLSPVHPLHQSQSTRFNNCVSIKDSAGNRISLVFGSGKMYRFGLPPMCESVIVRKIIIALRQVLPKESLKLMTRWYAIRNGPGTVNFGLRKEWELFKNLLFEMIGRPHEKSHSFSVCSNASSVGGGARKRRKSENNCGSNSDWEYLLNADNLVNKTESDHEDHDMDTHYKSDAILFEYIPLILYTLHLLYEDLKLDSSFDMDLKFLSEFLYQLAYDFDLENYRLHYFLDNPQLIYFKTKITLAIADSQKLKNKELIKSDEPTLNIFQEIMYLTDVNIKLRRYPYIPNTNTMSKNIVEILSLIFDKTRRTSDSIEYIKLNNTEEQHGDKMSDTIPTCSVAQQVIDSLIEKGITRTTIDRFPTAVHYIVSQALETARMSPPIGCSPAAYKLLLRPELDAHAAFKVKNSKNATNMSKNKLETSLTPRILTQPDVIAKSEKAIVEDDGMEHIDTKLLRLRFPDLRINDVKKFLNSSKPVTIDVVQSPNVSDHEFIEEQEKQLFSLCTRTMALPIGRGMFTFKTYFPVLTELLPIPKLCLTGKEISHRGATIELQQIEVPANMSLWPQFHNGVAAGLRIATDPKDIDPAWVIYNEKNRNKPKDAATEIPPSYAGFLMALGMTSSLKALSDTYLYDYLIRSEELVSVGLLLGMAASYRGTMDSKITRMLSIHVEALLPPTAIELDVSHNVQVASLLGIGLLYQNQAKHSRHIAEALLQEINRPPGPEMENYVERESYSLAAGLALGMVTLGTGNKDIGLDDLQLADILHYYMIGGNKRQLTGAQKEKYKLPSFQIREGDQVNIDVTAPGATLALGLMFFQSDNEAVADWMKPPETMYLLDFVRPDLLLLRVLARGLILWNSIEPTTEWINSQISKTLSKIIQQQPDPDTDTNDMDHEAICQAYCNIVTGAAMSIGLRFAGTENPIAFKTLKKIITFFLSANGQYIGEYSGKATVESSIVLVLISMSLVFAGTGHLHILRLIRMARSRIGSTHSQVTYGSHMAIHMALGFLFLGAGRFTISRRPEAIAALVCSLFPKFPMHSNDCRYHLQAFRHLYVLAVEPRLFLPRDIDTGRLVVCKLSFIELGKNVSITVTRAPCMLPELDTLKMVVVNDPNYWPVTFERGRNWDQLTNLLNANGCFDIKQRAGCLSQVDGPNQLKSLLAQTLTADKYTSWKVEPNDLLSFSNDKLVVELTKNLLTVPHFHFVEGLGKLSQNEDDTRHAILLQTYDCLTRDKIHALPIYMALMQSIERVKNQKQNNNSSDVWQIKIMKALVWNQPSQIAIQKSVWILSIELLTSMLLKYDTVMGSKKEEIKFLLRNFLAEKNLDFLQEFCVDALQQLGMLIVFYNFPLNFINKPLNLENVNVVQFLYEMKNRDTLTHHQHDQEFLLNLWHLLKC